MKFLSLGLFTLFISAQTTFAYSNTYCSNANGSVIWEEGRNANAIKLVYKGFVTGTLELPIDQVNIQLSNEKILKEEGSNNCQKPMTARVFTAEAIIVPSEKTPDVFQSYFPDQEVRSVVICEQYVSARANCQSDE